jgi:hypothetical protein
MIKYHSQLEESQDKELLNGLGSIVSSNNCEQQFLEYLLNEPKQYSIHLPHQGMVERGMENN